MMALTSKERSGQVIRTHRGGSRYDNYIARTIVIDDQKIEAHAWRFDPDGTWELSYLGSSPQVDGFTWKPGETIARIDWHTQQVSVLKVNPTTTGVHIRYRGADFRIQVLAPHIAQYLPHMPVKVPPDMSRFLLCPMPGQVVRIDVAEGDIVEDGQTLAIVEAMKMENVLKAEKRARVSKVHAVPGAVLAVDQVILEFEAV
jgi:propionyl-CoA carboxylase alpha chain